MHLDIRSKHLCNKEDFFAIQKFIRIYKCGYISYQFHCLLSLYFSVKGSATNESQDFVFVDENRNFPKSFLFLGARLNNLSLRVVCHLQRRHSKKIARILQEIYKFTKTSSHLSEYRQFFSKHRSKCSNRHLSKCSSKHRSKCLLKYNLKHSLGCLQSRNW